MVVKNFRLWLLPLLLTGSLSAQAVRVSSYLQKDQISRSEQMQLNLEIKSDGRINIPTPSAPQVPGFNYRSMRNSSSSQTSISGGSVNTQYTLGYSYFYTPQRTGRFTVPGFQLRIGSRDYSTSPLSVEVVDSPSGPSPNQQYNLDPYIDPYGSSYFGRNRTAGESLILCLPESQSVFVGQPAIVSYYLYTNQMAESFSTETERDYEGYGKSSFEQPTNLKYETVTYRNERWQRALIKRLVLYPQVSGRLQAPTLSGIVQFSGVYSFLNKSIDSRPAWLEVNALPAGKPAGYTGAVGSFTLSQSYSGDKLTLGEALVCTIKISGKGNFSQFTAPSFPGLDKFQISEPSVSDKLANPIEGTRFIYYTILPSETGSYEIPGFSFSWFDTATGSYRTFNGASHAIAVRPSNVLSYFSGLLHGDRPKSLNPLLQRSDYPPFRNIATRAWFWLILIACLLGLIVAGFFAWERRISRLNPNLYAQKTANRILTRYLRQANEAAKDLSPSFYPLAESGLLTYLAKKYGVSKGLTTSELVAELQSRGLSENLAEQIEAFLLLCQKARFMPGGSEAAPLLAALAQLRGLVQALGRNKHNGPATPKQREEA